MTAGMGATRSSATSFATTRALGRRATTRATRATTTRGRRRVETRADGTESSSAGAADAPMAAMTPAPTTVKSVVPFVEAESSVEVAEDDYRGTLRLFLDSADADTYDAWLPTGMFTGVTTNPAILERDGVECSVEALSALARNALEFDAVEEFQVQTWGEDSDEMWKNGIALARQDPERLVVKVPATLEGIKAANALVCDGVRVTITAAYAPHQVLVAASIGANYVAPYLGRMNDAGRDGMGTIISMQETVDELESDMRVLVASVRTAAEVSKLAAKGCDTFTIGEKVAAEMFADPLTTQAALDFESAAKRMAPAKPKKKEEVPVEEPVVEEPEEDTSEGEETSTQEGEQAEE